MFDNFVSSITKVIESVNMQDFRTQVTNFCDGGLLSGEHKDARVQVPVCVRLRKVAGFR